MSESPQLPEGDGQTAPKITFTAEEARAWQAARRKALIDYYVKAIAILLAAGIGFWLLLNNAPGLKREANPSATASVTGK